MGRDSETDHASGARDFTQCDALEIAHYGCNALRGALELDLPLGPDPLNGGLFTLEVLAASTKS